MAKYKQSLIVIDGHDGSGKTTIAKLVAEKMNGRYVKPFPDTLGDTIFWLSRFKRHDEVNLLSKIAIERALNINNNSSLLVFDRHWLSIFTLLPIQYYKYWEPLPLTILFWANINTTMSRIEARGEEIGNIEEHIYYINLYKEIAIKYKIPILDTSKMGVNESFEYFLKNYGGLLEGALI